MKERPILFNSEMIRAILDGRKTQTRRPVKQPPPPIPKMQCLIEEWVRLYHVGTDWRECPYGKPGDRLWVRETHQMVWHDQGKFTTDDANMFFPPDHSDSRRFDIVYAADPDAQIHWEPQRWRPSIHMPRWASRITLEITRVRMDRVQEISEDDAKAEGCPSDPWRNPKQWLEDNWPYAKASAWSKNPWVWVVEFKRVEA